MGKGPVRLRACVLTCARVRAPSIRRDRSERLSCMRWVYLFAIALWVMAISPAHAQITCACSCPSSQVRRFFHLSLLRLLLPVSSSCSTPCGARSPPAPRAPSRNPFLVGIDCWCVVCVGCGWPPQVCPSNCATCTSQTQYCSCLTSCFVSGNGGCLMGYSTLGVYTCSCTAPCTTTYLALCQKTCVVGSSTCATCAANYWGSNCVGTCAALHAADALCRASLALRLHLPLALPRPCPPPCALCLPSTCADPCYRVVWAWGFIALRALAVHSLPGTALRPAHRLSVTVCDG
jgi:hypothetical protein